MSDLPPLKPIPARPPTTNVMPVPRAGWNPPRRRGDDIGKDMRYQGHYRPAQFMPNYGNSLGAEVDKARSYYEKNLQGKPGDPRLDYNRIQRTFPVYSGPMSRLNSLMTGHSAGGHFYAPVPWDQKDGANLSNPAQRQIKALVGHSPAAITTPSRPLREDELERMAQAGITSEKMYAANATKPDELNLYDALPSDYRGLQHEMRHAWTARDGGGALIPNAAALAMQAYHPGAPHGISELEQTGWLSGLQHELYKQRGSRLETPEAAEDYLREMIDLPEEEFESRVKDFESDSARGMRHLRYLRHGIPDVLKGEGELQVDPSPTTTHHFEGKRLPESKWLGPLSGMEIPFTDEDITIPSEYQQAKEKAPEVLDNYIEWLSRLAPALVSTQDGQNEMAKAATLQDFLEPRLEKQAVLTIWPTPVGMAAGAGIGALAANKLTRPQDEDEEEQEWRRRRNRNMALAGFGGATLGGILGLVGSAQMSAKNAIKKGLQYAAKSELKNKLKEQIFENEGAE